MMTIADLRPGDIGFGPQSSAPAKALVTLGQLILGEGFTVGPLSIGHVFIMTASYPLPNDQHRIIAVEAMPSGAREVGINGRWDDRFAYVRLPEDYPGQASDAAAIARAMVGTPYSFLSYAALAAWRFGWKTPRFERWIDRRRPAIPIRLSRDWQPRSHSDTMTPIALPREAICSVLVDQAWSLAGKRVMEGVAHQCVTPGALARRLFSESAVGRARWIWPGQS